MAVGIARRKVHGREITAIAQYPINKTDALKKRFPIEVCDQAHAGNDISHRHTGGRLLLVLGAHDFIRAGSLSSQTFVKPEENGTYFGIQITQAQEAQWQPVAQAMRDNQKTIEPLVTNRKDNAKTMTAIDDLKSYAQIAGAHADGAKTFITAFEPLYSGMSDAQKKDADALFRNGVGKAMKSAGKSQ